MKATVLLVDDYPGSRDSLGRTLREEGYAVTVASNGWEALNSMRNTGFDLALLDVDMAVNNEWDTLAEIITVSLSLPLIIITALPDHQHPAAHKGVAAVLEKPIDLPVLLSVMERALAETSESRGRGARPESA
jgi:DNA-binding NtrC family response regulator